MARRKKAKLEMNEKTQSILSSVEETLKARGVSEINLGELIDLVFQKCEKSDIDSFVSNKTPIEYKMKALMQDKVAMLELSKLAEQHNFGIK